MDLPLAKVPCRLTRQLKPCGSLAGACLPAFSAPSTFFQLTEPLSAAWSSTRSALREFVTVTVTVGASAGVFGLSFAGAAAAGAGAAFCASACAAGRPQSATASARAKLRPVMNLLLNSRASGVSLG